MGKNHRHKKQLKLEKAKTKLRVKNEKTKFLPKGLNVTKTDFKIKPIVLPEQLKEKSSDEVLSKRKLNLKDILSRLKHHNTTVKHDCCEELKQILSVHLEEIIELHLSQILQGLSPLLLDKEKSVRRSTIKTLNVILENVDLEKIEPFFPILVSYLCCAMTNIDRAIQEDSLLFLDSLLKNIPNLVANSSEKILPNLFALISKLRNDSKPGRTLTVNLGSKITNVKWRIQVLSRLYGFLSAVFKNQDKKLDQREEVGVVNFVGYGTQIPLFYNPYKKNLIICDKKVTVEGEGDAISTNIPVLMSLLYEIWLEVAPTIDVKESDTTLLTGETAAVLTCILNVLYLLFEHKKNIEDKFITKKLRNDFFTNDCLNFLNNILIGFPFTQNQEKKGAVAEISKILQIDFDSRFLQQNLLICFLFSFAHTKLNTQKKIKDARNVLDYITGILNKKINLQESQLPLFKSLVEILLLENSVYWKEGNLDLEIFLTKLLQTFKQKEGRFQDDLFDIFCKLEKIEFLKSSESYQNWLFELPKLLLKPKISSKMLSMLLMISKRNNSNFLQGLQDSIFEILNNFKLIQIEEDEEIISSKVKILYLFYYVPKLSSKQFDYLKEFQSKCEDVYKNIVKLILEKEC